MNKEVLHVVNFGGLTDVTINVNKKFTLILGAQASGKSIIAKLLYFFKGFISLRGLSLDPKSIESIESAMANRFLSLFPERFWPEGAFVIDYSFDDIHFFVKRSSSDVVFSVPFQFKNILNLYLDLRKTALDSITDKGSETERSMADFLASFSARQQCVEKAREAGFPVGEQFFVIASRSFYSEMNDNMTLLFANKVPMEQLLLESYSIISSAKRAHELNLFKNDNKIQEMIHGILKAEFKKEDEKEYLLHSDGRKIELQYASSGQQEAFPLLMVLNYVNGASKMSTDSICLYIEEPEAHIFPSAQKAVVDLISYISNTSQNIQVILTTHSPYIMSSFNYLIEAGNVVLSDSSKKEDVEKIVGVNEAIRYDDVYAYMLNNGTSSSLMSDSDKLINPAELDEVSNAINFSFEKLLDL